jgi:hypothetical protein
LIATLNTTETDGVVVSLLKVPCIVAVIVGAPNRNRRPLSTRALIRYIVTVFTYLVGSYRNDRRQGIAVIVYTRKITVTLSLQTTNVSGKSHVFLAYTLDIVQRETFETISHY